MSNPFDSVSKAWAGSKMTSVASNSSAAEMLVFAGARNVQWDAAHSRNTFKFNKTLVQHCYPTHSVIRKCAIYFHGNAENILEVGNAIGQISLATGMHIFSLEYPGYLQGADISTEMKRRD